MKNVLKLVFMPVVLLSLAGCFQQLPPTNTSTYNLTELKYRLFSEFNVFWVNPYLWPLSRDGQEQQDALSQYPAIKANGEEFTAIANYLSLSIKDNYTDAEKLLIFRQHEKLALAVQMTASGEGYDFILREGEGQGWRYEGKINTHGVSVITKLEPSINTYPICLAEGTSIDTPAGNVAVETLEPDIEIWSLDGHGNRIAVNIIKVSKTAVPTDFEIVSIVLADGRTVTASPNHPTANGKPTGDLKVGDAIDGSNVASIELQPYAGAFTYDVLPDGETGVYWANGILLRSTLTK